CDSYSALTHTVIDSAQIPWMPRWLSVVSAASSSWSQVTGSDMSSPASSATDSRYHSSCVLAQKGTATSSSSQVAPCTAPSTTSWVELVTRSSGTGARKPGSASSGM